MTTTNLTMLAGSAVTDFATIRKHCGAIRSIASPTSAVVHKGVGSTPLLATASSTMKIVFAISLTYTALAVSLPSIHKVVSFIKALSISSLGVISLGTVLAKILSITSGPTIVLRKSVTKTLTIASPIILFFERALALIWTVFCNKNVFLAKRISLSRAVEETPDITIIKDITKGLDITSSLVASIKKRMAKLVSAVSTNTATIVKSPLVVFLIVSATYATMITGKALRQVWLILCATEITLIKIINPILSIASPIIIEIAKIPTKVLAIATSATNTLVKTFYFGSTAAFLVTSQPAITLAKVLSLRVRLNAISELIATADLTNYIRQAYTMTLSLICTPDITLETSSTLIQRYTQALNVTCEVSISFYKTLSKTLAATTQGILDMIRSWG